MPRSRYVVRRLEENLKFSVWDTETDKLAVKPDGQPCVDLRFDEALDYADALKQGPKSRGEQQSVRVCTMTNPSETNDDQAKEAARELRIREKAYQLWELDGSPQGQAEHYWNRARKLVDADEAEATKTLSA